MEITLKQLAFIETDFKKKFGIPRQSGRVESLEGRIIFLPEYRNPDAIRSIEGFSHIWLIFDFSDSHRDTWSPTVRPPRLGGNKRVGVFASRSPFRPNPIGLSCVRLLGVEKTAEYGAVLIVCGADLLDGTPIYDIKPYIPHTDCRPEAVGGYADEQSGYRLDVDFPPELLLKIPENKRNALVSCIADDPRPSYIDSSERVYGMAFLDFDVHFKVNGNLATVIDVKKITDISNIYY